MYSAITSDDDNEQEDFNELVINIKIDLTISQ